MSISQTVSKDMIFFANNFKHRHIIYHWKEVFITSMDSRSLPQNKTSFGSDQLTKFIIFARKKVSTIQAFSLQTEVTILMRRPREIDWNLEMAVKVAWGRRSNARSCGPLTCVACPIITASGRLLSSAQSGQRLLRQLG